MRTIFVSPEFPLNRRMRKAVRRGKLQVVREGGERLSLGGGIGGASKKFETLCLEAKACTLCSPSRIEHGSSVLGPQCGSCDASLMFIGEAPGRLGAHITQLPFHGDQTGKNFEALLESVGIARHDVFITNAVLCNPRDKEGRNSKPLRGEVKNCGPFLQRQIELVNPEVIATLGERALMALGKIEPHGLDLRQAVGTVRKWKGRALIPMYHPSPRNCHPDIVAKQECAREILKETWHALAGRGLHPRPERSTPA